MGWDVMQIGLRHNLPVHDMFATAKECSMRLKRNINLYAFEEYKFDVAANTISSVDPYSSIELGRFKYDDSDDYDSMIVWNYQKRHIIDLVGIEKLRNATFLDEHAKLILQDDPDMPLYELFGYAEIYEENVGLNIYMGRWWYFCESFSSEDEKRHNELKQYRMLIHERAMLFGCNELIICPDQWIGEYIYDHMNMTADDLRSYVKERRYIDDCYDSEEEKESIRKEARQINFSDYIDGGLTLKEKEWVDVVFDKVE